MGQVTEQTPIRALIVEDNRDICGNIAEYLERHHYVLDFAYDGMSAVQLAFRGNVRAIHGAHPFSGRTRRLARPKRQSCRFVEPLTSASGVNSDWLTSNGERRY